MRSGGAAHKIKSATDFKRNLTAPAVEKKMRRQTPLSQGLYFCFLQPARETLINSLSEIILEFFIQSKERKFENSELFKNFLDADLNKNSYDF